MDDAALEEKRRKDRERYRKKKEDGLIKTIKDFTPREQRQIRKIWRQKAQLRRDKEKMNKRIQEKKIHLLANYISKLSKAERIIWHFSETGHGKGAPDGVGG